jgi:hypothetical protein
MKLKEGNSKLREAATLDLYKSDKNFRADRLVSAWSKVPELGVGLKKLPLTEARNVAINLDRQLNFMQNLKESQMATALNDFTPENMLRLVRLAMPNVIRSKVFTEIALESTKDSIKYIRPHFAKTANGHPLLDKSPDFQGAEDAGYDPWDYDDAQLPGNINADKFRRALYEDTRDRPNQELANAIVDTKKLPSAAGTATVKAFFKDMSAATAPANLTAEEKFESKKWGVNGANYVDGYLYIYYGDKAAGNPAQFEQNLVAMQDKASKSFFAAPGFTVTGTWNAGEYTFQIVADAEIPDGKGGKIANPALGKDLFIYGRYNSESDFEGNYLGEVQISMDEYFFRPSMTAIGVSWSQLTEITLDTSFNISAEEYLVTYAAQEIRAALDYHALRLAYGYAKANGRHNPNYIYHFDCAYSTVGLPAGQAGTKDGYVQNAQTLVNAIEAVGDVMYDDLNRGGVSRLVAGPSACSYIRLNLAYSPRGKQTQNGSHQYGALDDLLVFKVPSNIVPTNEIMCIWKNDQVENDVAIAFGTLVPFFSTGIIQRKNFYKEAGIATWGDQAVLNRRYIALIVLENLKDFNQKATIAA